MTNFEISIRFFLQLAGVLLGPSLLGRLAPGWQAYLFPKQTMTVLYGKQRDALLATAGRTELTIASAVEIGQRAPQIAPGTAHLRPEVPRTDVLGVERDRTGQRLPRARQILEAEAGHPLAVPGARVVPRQLGGSREIGLRARGVALRQANRTPVQPRLRIAGR